MVAGQMLMVVKLKEKVEQAGGVYLSTPVSGQPAAARAKQLVVVASGDAQGKERVLPLLEAIGKKVIDVGEDNAKGERLIYDLANTEGHRSSCSGTEYCSGRSSYTRRYMLSVIISGSTPKSSTSFTVRLPSLCRLAGSSLLTAQRTSSPPPPCSTTATRSLRAHLVMLASQSQRV